MSSALQAVSSSSSSCAIPSVSTPCVGIRQRRTAIRVDVHDSHTTSRWLRGSTPQPFSSWLPRPGVCHHRFGSSTHTSSPSPQPHLSCSSFPPDHQYRSLQAPASAPSPASASASSSISYRRRHGGLSSPGTARCRAVFTPVGSEAADMGVTSGGPGPGAGSPGFGFGPDAVVELPSTQDSQQEEDTASGLHHQDSPHFRASAGNGYGPATQPASSSVNAGTAAADTDASSAQQQQQPSSSGPVPFTLDGLSETQKLVFAEEWGYTRVGADFPRGTHPSNFSPTLPTRFFDFNLVAVARCLALPLAAMALGYGWLWYWHSICPAWQQACCAVLIGTAYTGLFKVAHECARYSFLPQTPELQEALGTVLMLPSLYPFPCWRLGFMHHLLHLNMLWEDSSGWQPLTKVEVVVEVLREAAARAAAASAAPTASGSAATDKEAAAAAAASEAAAAAAASVAGGAAEGAQGASAPQQGLTGSGAAADGGLADSLRKGSAGGVGSWRLALHRWVCCTPLKLFLGSMGHWLRSWEAFDLRRFHPASYGSVLAGWAAPLLFVGLGFPAMLAAGGVSGFVSCYLAPWLVFHFWLSTLSLLQHTGPHIPFLAEGEGYDAGRAAISGTVTVRLPRPLELLLNEANYGLPQIIAPGLPCYHAREAYEHVRERLLPYISEATLNMKLLINHVTKWQVYDEEAQTYRPLDEVVSEVRAELAAAVQEAEEEAVAEAAAALEEAEQGGSSSSSEGRGGDAEGGNGAGLAVA